MKEYRLKINGNEYVVAVNSVDGKNADVTVNGKPYSVEIEKKAEENAPAVTAAPQKAAAPVASSRTKAKTGHTVTSPLPGTILRVNVGVGDVVRAGQVVAVVEAMKMENDIEAENAGTVTAVHVQACDSVLEGAPLITIA